MTEAQLAALLARTGTPGAPNVASTENPPFLPAFGLLKDPYESMNGLERSYAEHLQAEMGKSIVWWAYESIRLKLADRTTLTVDFFVQRISGALEAHETKGFVRDDAIVKLKVAAAQFPFKFFLIKKASNGGWDVKEINR